MNNMEPVKPQTIATTSSLQTERDKSIPTPELHTKGERGWETNTSKWGASIGAACAGRHCNTIVYEDITVTSIRARPAPSVSP